MLLRSAFDSDKGGDRMSYRSLAEWNARGRQILKGSQCMGRLNDGTPLFGKEQTQKTPKGPGPYRPLCGYSGGSGTNWDQGYDRDQEYEDGLIGIPGQW